MEPRMKRSVKIMYTLIDDLYMIAKNIKNENDINKYFCENLANLTLNSLIL